MTGIHGSSVVSRMSVHARVHEWFHTAVHRLSGSRRGCFGLETGGWFTGRFMNRPLFGHAFGNGFRDSFFIGGSVGSKGTPSPMREAEERQPRLMEIDWTGLSARGSVARGSEEEGRRRPFLSSFPCQHGLTDRGGFPAREGPAVRGTPFSSYQMSCPPVGPCRPHFFLSMSSPLVGIVEREKNRPVNWRLSSTLEYY